MAALIFKVAVALLAGVLGAWALRTRLLGLPERRFLGAALALQLVPALALFLVLYAVGHQEPTSDVPAYYLPAARAVLAGQVPFRDFALSYAPGFAYVGAAVLWIWNSGKAFALFAIAMNALALLCWHLAARTLFGVNTARRSTILYATSGHLLLQALLGTNQVWVSAGLAASVLLAVRDRDAAAGWVQGIAAGATKVLAHLFWPMMWICARRRARWLVGAVLPIALLYGACVIAGAGAGLLYPLRHEGELITPGNLPYVLDLVLGSAGALERPLFDGLLLVALACVTLWVYRKARALQPESRRALLLTGLALTGLTFMLFSKKSFTGYAVFVMYPVILTRVGSGADSRSQVLFLTVFNVLLAAEPSLWFYLGGNPMPLHTWVASGGGAKAAGFLAVDAPLLACYVYLAWLSVRGIRRIADGAIAARSPVHSAAACSLL